MGCHCSKSRFTVEDLTRLFWKLKAESISIWEFNKTVEYIYSDLNKSPQTAHSGSKFKNFFMMDPASVIQTLPQGHTWFKIAKIGAVRYGTFNWYAGYEVAGYETD